MLEPSPGLTPEETTLFIAELEQRWRDAERGEKERLACVLDLWLKSIDEGVSAIAHEHEAGGDRACKMARIAESGKRNG